jgi:site-specific recombinase XerD
VPAAVPAAVRDFLDYLRQVRELRATTIRWYQYALVRAAAAIEPTPILEATETQVRDFVERRGRSGEGRNQEISALRGFFRWAEMHDLRADDQHTSSHAPDGHGGSPGRSATKTSRSL